MVRVTGSWEANSEDEHGAILIAWNLDVGCQVGALPTANVKAKLRRLTIVNYKNHKWS